MFVNDRPDAEIKLIDFGLSKKYASDKELTEGVGTIYTMAPEVLKGGYTAKADLWSVGVIAYMLMSSQMPFYGRKRRHIVEQIMRCQYSFKGQRWKRISRQAKMFIEDLLVLDADERLDAEDALGSTWLNQSFTATTRAPTVDEIGTTTERLKTYSNYSNLKKLALMVIAHKSTTQEIGILRKVFQKYDTSKDGTIEFEEFKECLSQYGYSEAEVTQMFQAVDLDGTGQIRYTEFLAATIEAHGAIDEERLAEAFDRLDSDDSGFISAANLREMLGANFPQDRIDEIIHEADLTQDNRISYPEFLALWEDRKEEERKTLYQKIQPPSSMEDSFGVILQEMNTEVEDNANDRVDVPETSVVISRTNFIECKKMSERRTNIASSSIRDDPDNKVMPMVGEDAGISDGKALNENPKQQTLQPCH